jgi:hypothetical protein
MDDDDKDGEEKETPDDSKFGGELADGVNRIRVSLHQVRSPFLSKC